MTTHVHGLIAHRPIQRPAKLIWTVLAVVALAVVVTVVVLTTRHHAQPLAPDRGGNSVIHGQAWNADCVPTRVIHPC